MSSLSRDLVFLILKFLDEEKFKDTVHRLEQESGIYFNMKHLEDSVINGEWEEVERYLSGFTKMDDNGYSMKIFFQIRKQKYLEALDKRDRSKALDILVKDLKVFSAFNEDLFKETTHLLTLDNFRENEQLSKYGDTKTARTVILTELKKLIEANPLFRDKLQFPNLKNSRLRTLICQSFNGQHQLCKNPRPNPDMKTLFYDHSCNQPNGARLPSPAPPLMNVMQKPVGFPPMGHHVPFQQAAATLSSPSLAGWMANSSTAPPMPHPAMSGAVSGSALGLAIPPNPAALMKRPLTPPAADYHSADSEHVLSKRSRPMGLPDEVGMSAGHLPMGYPSIARNSYSTEVLPKTVAAVLNQGSTVMSMDFHPSQPTVLLVGTNVGDIDVWEASCRKRFAHKAFKPFNLPACSVVLQSILAKESSVSVNRVLWNPDGTRFGVAYSRHLVQLFNYNGREDLVYHLEIDAHVGGVNDIAFSQPNNKGCVVSCGDDKLIKVWDAINGSMLYTFEGHDAPVYSICSHSKGNIQFIFSTSLDGKIKAWLYDNGGSRVDYTAPGQWCTTMSYSADGARLFSCGTSKEGETYIIEWNESEGSVKRAYQGFRKRSNGVVQFDTTKSRFLAAGDEFLIKFWDMDNINLLTTTDAGGDLQASPLIRFNKLGSLLAVSTSNNSIKILANTEGSQMLRSLENRSYNVSRSTSEAITKAPMLIPLGPNATVGTNIAVSDRGAPVSSIGGLNCDNRSLGVSKPINIDETVEKSKIWKLVEINEPSQCSSLKLYDTMLLAKVAGLIYTNSGSAILSLACNAVHKLWKWQKNEPNVTGKATTSVPPQLCQPSDGILMTNELGDSNSEDTIHCFALSKNDSYVISASGGKISLFNMINFKTITAFMAPPSAATFLAPPSAATFLAFHPQDNNIIAVGMDDSSIHIYNVQINEVKIRLRGHQKRITGLAFSNVVKCLISSGADAQMCVWETDGWDRQVSKSLQIPSGCVLGSFCETKVQFHNDQNHFLVVHESQLAIYETSKLDCLKQWIPGGINITHATYSCDGELIYASFMDGSVAVLNSSLRLRARINPTVYLSSPPSSSVYPVVVAANPIEKNQFAIGLTDGSIQVIEPLESEGKWGTDPPPETNGASSSVKAASSTQPPSNPTADQQSRR